MKKGRKNDSLRYFSSWHVRLWLANVCVYFFFSFVCFTLVSRLQKQNGGSGRRAGMKWWQRTRMCVCRGGGISFHQNNLSPIFASESTSSSKLKFSSESFLFLIIYFWQGKVEMENLIDWKHSILLNSKKFPILVIFFFNSFLCVSLKIEIF